MSAYKKGTSPNLDAEIALLNEAPLNTLLSAQVLGDQEEETKDGYDVVDMDGSLEKSKKVTTELTASRLRWWNSWLANQLAYFDTEMTVKTFEAWSGNETGIPQTQEWNCSQYCQQKGQTKKEEEVEESYSSRLDQDGIVKLKTTWSMILIPLVSSKTCHKFSVWKLRSPRCRGIC